MNQNTALYSDTANGLHVTCTAMPDWPWNEDHARIHPRLSFMEQVKGDDNTETTHPL